MSFQAEYALAQYRAARHGQEPPPLPGLADPRALTGSSGTPSWTPGPLPAPPYRSSRVCAGRC
ncbi:hypothetical protein LUW77_18270 [Streptomyces radiopugnans]|nr:hypothetical protein LUW77_18270 [Streptomyces radiopugnans]